MNKKGQTLILFVILIPVIITLLAIIVDVGILLNEYQRKRGIIETAINTYFEENSVEKAQKILTLNEILLEKVKIKEENGEIWIFYDDEIDALFGKIIGLKSYPIKLHEIGKMKEGKVIITKKE